MNDLAPGIRGVDKVPQVVISDNDPIRFFSKMEQEPDQQGGLLHFQDFPHARLLDTCS